VFCFLDDGHGEARYVLGVKIVRNPPKKLLGICQEAYIKRVLERSRMHYFKPVDTPAEKGLTLSLNQCPKTDKKKRENEGCSICQCCKKYKCMPCYVHDLTFALRLAW